jgi:superfamily II DNA helicase RecQ
MISTQQPTNTADVSPNVSDTTIAYEAMQNVFSMEPHDWQDEAISHIIALVKANSCGPLLLVRPTGGGKSAVRDTVAVILAGVVLTISPLLSLGSDQNKKIGMKASQWQ